MLCHAGRYMYKGGKLVPTSLDLYLALEYCDQGEYARACSRTSWRKQRHSALLVVYMCVSHLYAHCTLFTVLCFTACSSTGLQGLMTFAWSRLITPFLYCRRHVGTAARCPGCCQGISFFPLTLGPCCVCCCRAGDLFHMRGQLSEAEVKVIMLQLMSAVQYLHRNGVWHRDIKSANILMTYTNGQR